MDYPHLMGRLWGAVVIAGLTTALLLAGSGIAAPPPAGGEGVVTLTDTYPTGRYPGDIAVGDFNGDATIDVVTADDSEDLSLFLGDGQGHLTPASRSPDLGSAGAWSVAAGDFNGDRKLDLAVAAGAKDEVFILLNDGRGDFKQAPGSPVPVVFTAEVRAGDLDGDGDLDLVNVDSGNGRLIPLTNNGAARFEPRPEDAAPLGSIPIEPAVGDLDGDELPDVAVANYGSGDISVLLNDGAGSFVEPPASPYSVGTSSGDLELVDLDGDERLDIVAPSNYAPPHEGELHVLLNRGSGSFVEPPDSPLPTDAVASSVASADLNLDGAPDVLVGSAGPNTVTSLLGDGAGGLEAQPPQPAGGDYPSALQTADLDRDGAPDLVSTLYVDQRVAVLLNRTTRLCGGEPATKLVAPDEGRVQATSGRDVIAGSAGTDRIAGADGRDVICGRGGDDRLIGGKSRDRLFGGRGTDVLFGGPDADLLLGGPGPDQLAGDEGRDRLTGGIGPDRCKQDRSARSLPC